MVSLQTLKTRTETTRIRDYLARTYNRHYKIYRLITLADAKESSKFSRNKEQKDYSKHFFFLSF